MSQSRESAIAPLASLRERLRRGLWLTAGLILVGIGFIGALLPLLPTTPFLILAVGCFARSSPRLEAWILNHAQFGPLVRKWQKHGAIPRPAKWVAVLSMMASYALLWFLLHPTPLMAAGIGAVMAGVGLWIATRPE